MLRFVHAIAVGAVVVAIVSSCNNHESACKVDTDCPQGQICRDERCGPVGSDGGPPPSSEGGTPVCFSDNTACVNNQDCCSGNCDNATSRCVTTAPPPSDCRGLYELCTGSECCSPLSCTSGSCR